MGWLELVLLVNVLGHCDVLVLGGISCLEVDLGHLSAVPLNHTIIKRDYHVLLCQK